MKLLLAAVAVSFLAGCATQQQVAHQTPSGQAEARFAGMAPEQVRDRIATACMVGGMRIAHSSANEVICSRTMTGGQAVATQLLIGNSYSTTPETVLRFNYAPDPMGGGVRVVIYPSIETQMAFGQVRRVPLTSVEDRNGLQRMLWSMGGS